MTCILLAVLLFLAPITPESGRFTITQNGRRVGTEEFTISTIGSGYLVQGRTQLTGTSGTMTSRMELDAKLNPTSYEYSRGGSTIRIRMEQPVSELITTEGGKESTVDFRFPKEGFIVDNNFFHHYLLLLYRVGEKGASLPVFVPQDVRQGEATIRPKGNRTFELIMGDVRLEATTDMNGRMLRLAVPAAGVVVER
jgi:hypothetical protein